MKSLVDITIKAPRTQLAEIFADPENTAKWMDDVRYEPISGTPASFASRGR